ncbi:hypothetical protein ADUPG1_009973, partial [Aduncisulcus paluster]
MVISDSNSILKLKSPMDMSSKTPIRSINRAKLPARLDVSSSSPLQSIEEVEDYITSTLSSSLVKSISDSKWKTREEAVCELYDGLESLKFEEQWGSAKKADSLIQWLGKHSLVDKHFKIASKAFDLVSKLNSTLHEECSVTFHRSTAELVAQLACLKLGDSKVYRSAVPIFLLLTKEFGVAWGMDKLDRFAVTAKSPALQAGGLRCACDVLTAYGYNLKKYGADTETLLRVSVHGINNPARNIRTQCLEFLKLCATFIGGSIIGLFFKKAGDKVSTA